MEKIASFTINHLKLLPGVYVSRKDAVGSETLTTFDLRMTAPNREPVMNTAEMHAISFTISSPVNASTSTRSTYPVFAAAIFNSL